MRRFLPALVAVLAVAGCGGHAALHASAPACAHGYSTPYGCQAHSPTFGLPGHNPLSLAPTATPTVEQYDTVTISTVPANPQAVAGYVGGSWPTYLPLVRAFPKALHVSIAVNAGEIADCLDIEPGDAVPSQAPGWVRWMISLHHSRPCLYSSWSEMHSVNADLGGSGIARSAVREWDANWTYVAHLDPGFDCTQWTDHSLGRNLDESTCARSFYGPLPKPKPVDPHHYLISPSSLKWLPGGLRGGPFPSPFGNLDERLVREQEGGASQHAAKYRPYLQHTLAPELSWLAGRLVVLACGDKQNGLFNLPCDWAPFNWGSREQFLLHAAQRARAGR